MDEDAVKFGVAMLIAFVLITIGCAYMQQRTIETTCGVKVSAKDALFYDLNAASCPMVTIKK